MQVATLAPDATSPAAAPLLLVEEISHRVLNEYTQAIATIRLAAADAPSTEARVTLLREANRLLRRAEAHRALQPPNDRSPNSLSDHLERLCSALVAAGLEEQGVRLTLVTEPIALPAGRCWRVALIVSELVAHSARCALRGGPGHIRVKIGETAGVGICCVADDSGATDLDLAPRAALIVANLAGELGGELAWRGLGAGRVAELHFPLQTMERLA